MKDEEKKKRINIHRPLHEKIKIEKDLIDTKKNAIDETKIDATIRTIEKMIKSETENEKRSETARKSGNEIAIERKKKNANEKMTKRNSK